MMGDRLPYRCLICGNNIQRRSDHDDGVHDDFEAGLRNRYEGQSLDDAVFGAEMPQDRRSPQDEQDHPG